MDRDQAWAEAIRAIGEKHGVNNPYFFEEAIRQAKGGWRSTAWNYAMKAGIPAEHLRAVYNLIWE